MHLDEQALVDALHGVDAQAPPDLVSRVRDGGRRRLVRRRTFVGAGAGLVAVAGGATAVALVPGSGHGIAPGTTGPSTQAVFTNLYAAPPAAGSQCNAGEGQKATPSDYPDLLLLPPADEQLTSVNVATQSLNCLPAHVALTALKLAGGNVTQGVVVEGPNAPTAAEVDEAGPGVGHFTPPDDQPILGQPATEFQFGNTDHIDAYWTEPDGGQWRATVSGKSPGDAVSLLNQLTLDPKDGTATLADASTDGWVVEPSAADVTSPDAGVMAADWTDAQGHRVSITVTQGPDRVEQFAGGAPAGSYFPEGYVGPVEFVTVSGHRAAYGPGGGILFWQNSSGVEVELTVADGSEAEIEQLADSLTLASPDDPRLN